MNGTRPSHLPTGTASAWRMSRRPFDGLTSETAKPCLRTSHPPRRMPWSLTSWLPAERPVAEKVDRCSSDARGNLEVPKVRSGLSAKLYHLLFKQSLVNQSRGVRPQILQTPEHPNTQAPTTRPPTPAVQTWSLALHGADHELPGAGRSAGHRGDGHCLGAFIFATWQCGQCSCHGWILDRSESVGRGAG